MPVDKIKRNKRMYEWKKENTERIDLLFEKGTKEKIRGVAQKYGMSISEYVRMAIKNQLENDKKS